MSSEIERLLECLSVVRDDEAFKGVITHGFPNELAEAFQIVTEMQLKSTNQDKVREAADPKLRQRRPKYLKCSCCGKPIKKHQPIS